MAWYRDTLIWGRVRAPASKGDSGLGWCFACAPKDSVRLGVGNATRAKFFCHSFECFPCIQQNKRTLRERMLSRGGRASDDPVGAEEEVDCRYVEAEGLRCRFAPNFQKEWFQGSYESMLSWVSGRHGRGNLRGTLRWLWVHEVFCELPSGRAFARPRQMFMFVVPIQPSERGCAGKLCIKRSSQHSSWSRIGKV